MGTAGAGAQMDCHCNSRTHRSVGQRAKYIHNILRAPQRIDDNWQFSCTDGLRNGQSIPVPLSGTQRGTTSVDEAGLVLLETHMEGALLLNLSDANHWLTCLQSCHTPSTPMTAANTNTQGCDMLQLTDKQTNWTCHTGRIPLCFASPPLKVSTHNGFEARDRLYLRPSMKVP